MTFDLIERIQSMIELVNYSFANEKTINELLINQSKVIKT